MAQLKSIGRDDPPVTGEERDDTKEQAGRAFENKKNC